MSKPLPPPEGYMNQKEAAAYLGLSAQNLSSRRYSGTKLSTMRANGQTCYKMSELRELKEQRKEIKKDIDNRRNYNYRKNQQRVNREKKAIRAERQKHATAYAVEEHRGRHLVIAKAGNTVCADCPTFEAAKAYLDLQRGKVSPRPLSYF